MPALPGDERPSAPDEPLTSTSETVAQPSPTVAIPQPAATRQLAPGALLAGRFRIVALLGRGGMGEVYRAEDLKLGQTVALKFLSGPIDDAGLRRFYREVRLGREIAHPNVCRSFDVFEDAGQHVLAMEYVDGEDLASLLRRIGRLPPDKALEVARGLGSGLAAAHEKGILHRDLKPANVMIDGRGRPRIMDFGLAVLPHERGEDTHAGTPAYMAPEQLAGGEATPRSDIYALGLVLYEMLSGRRAFEARSLSDLIRLQAETPPPLSSSVRDLDPAVERVVRRCLDRDPAGRPESVRDVLAELPGGDALDAAVARGETPSPELVAASSIVGDLSRRAAWGWLGLAVAGLAACFALGERVSLHRLAPLPKDPVVLLDRARELAARAAPDLRRVDEAFGFETDARYLAGARLAQDPGQRLRTDHPGAISFWYRSAEAPLVARSWIARAPWAFSVRPTARVTREQPALAKPGMLEIVLDPQGRLLSFARVRDEGDDAAVFVAEAPLDGLLRDAGLDPSRLTPATPDGVPRVPGDAQQAWDTEFDDTPGRPIRVRAATWRGRLAELRISAREDDEATPAATAARATLGFALQFMLMEMAVFMVVVVWLIIRNLRARRSDRRSAFRLALGVALSGALALKLSAHFPGSLYDFHDAWMATDAQAIYWAVITWLMYVALEPVVRRGLPHALVGWVRLLSGRLRDPLVGRDVLIGAAVGSLFVPLWAAGDLLTLSLGGALPAPSTIVVPALATPGRSLLVSLLAGLTPAILQALSGALMYVLVQAVIGRRGATATNVLCFAVVGAAGASSPPEFLAALAVAGLVIAVFLKAGVLALVVAFYSGWILLRAPLSLDVSAWYAWSGALVAAIVASLALCGFVISLAGKPALGRSLLPD